LLVSPEPFCASIRRAAHGYEPAREAAMAAKADGGNEHLRAQNLVKLGACH